MIRTWLQLASVLLVLWGPTAVAAPLQAEEIIAGQDLVAWRNLHQARLSDSELIASYRLFIETYPTSPLSEVAWVRLQQLQSDQSTWLQRRRVRRTVQRLESSSKVHQRRLAVVSTDVAITKIEPNATPQPPRPFRPWRTAVHIGGGYDGDQPSLQLGARVGWGSLDLLVRAVGSDPWYAEVDVRTWIPRVRWLFVEGGVDHYARSNARAGVHVRLTRDLSLEASGGVRFAARDASPILRLEISNHVVGGSRR